MTLRKPLVVNNGQVEQLQAGDTLDAPQSGGDVVVLTNDEVTAVVIGAPVYIDANDGFKKAQANAIGTKDVVGLVAVSPNIANGVSGSVQINGVVVATTVQWDAVTGSSGGLVKNQKYWLDPAASGHITATAPTTVGQYVVLIGIGLSTTELLLTLQPGQDILL